MTREERTLHKLDIFRETLENFANLSVSLTHKVACMIFKRDFSSIPAFGYNGSYAGAEINPETNGEEISLAPGHSGFVHAEMNCLIKFTEKNPEDYVVFLTLSPCYICAQLIINAGFKYVYWLENYRDTSHLHIFDKALVYYGDYEVMKKDMQSIRR